MLGDPRYATALWFAIGAFVFSCSSLIWMGIHDWLEERRRKRLPIIHVPPPRG